MICSNCRTQSCDDCLSVDCGCRHRGSGVRSLTGQERHEYMLGLRDRYVLPTGSPYAAPISKAVISIRTSPNGSQH